MVQHVKMNKSGACALTMLYNGAIRRVCTCESYSGGHYYMIKLYVYVSRVGGRDLRC